MLSNSFGFGGTNASLILIGARSRLTGGAGPGQCALTIRIAAALLIAVIVGAGVGWLALDRWLYTPGQLASPVTVDLPRGLGLGGIAARLGEAGVVDRPWLLQLVARVSGRDRRLRAGEYAFEAGMSPDQVLAKLEIRRGRPCIR